MSAGVVLADAAAAPPQPVFAGQVRSGSFEVFERIAHLGPEFWRAHFAPHWKDYRYYQTLEEIFARAFPQRYLVLKDAAGDVRAVQPLFFVEQDLTVSLSEKLRAALRPLRRWLKPRLLMAGCIVGEGQTGLRDAADLAAVAEALDEALDLYARRERVSLILFKDYPVANRRALVALTAKGRYLRMPSLPAVQLDLDFASFDEYLQQRLGKSTRKSLRRKFKEADAAAEPIRLEVKASIDEAEATALHGLYERIALRGDVQFEVFTPEYFLRLGERMPDAARFFIWRQAGRIVAFSFCTVFGDAIHDNDIGLDEATAASSHLYHVTFRDIIRWALAHGLKRYHSSPFNYEPKLRLRMSLTPLDLYARHTAPLANRLLRWFAPLMAPTRQEKTLTQFPNATQIWRD